MSDLINLLKWAIVFVVVTTGLSLLTCSKRILQMTGIDRFWANVPTISIT
jgi:hypothetical protein